MFIVDRVVKECKSGLANGDAGAFGNQTVIEAPYGLSLGNAHDQIWNDAI